MYEAEQYKTISCDIYDSEGPRSLRIEVLATYEYYLQGILIDGTRIERRCFLKDWEIHSIYDLDSGLEVSSEFVGCKEVNTAIQSEL